MVVILAAVWYNESVKIKAYQGFPGFQPWLFSCSPVPLLRHIGLNGVQEAAGSNPVTRTIGVSFGMLRFFYPPLCYHTSYQAAAESPCIAHGSMISQYMIFYSTCHTFFRPLNRIADSHPNRQNTQAPCRRKRQGAYLFNQSKTSTLSSSPMASLMYVMVSPS